MPDSPTQALFTDSVTEVHDSPSLHCAESSASRDDMDHDQSVVVVDDSPKRPPIPVIDLTSPEHDSDMVTSTPNSSYSNGAGRDRSQTEDLMRRLQLARNRLAELRARRISQLEILPHSDSARSLPRFLQDDTEADPGGRLSSGDTIAHRLHDARRRFADLRARREHTLDLFLTNSARSGGRLTVPSRLRRRIDRFTPYSYTPPPDPSSSTTTDSPPRAANRTETFPLNHSTPITVDDDDTPTVIDVDGNTTSDDASQEEEEEIAQVNENLARIAQETRDAIARARYVTTRARETLERVRQHTSGMDDLFDRDSPLVNSADEALARNLQAQFDQEGEHRSPRRTPAASSSGWTPDEVYPPNVVNDGPVLPTPPMFNHRRRYGRTAATAHLPDMLLPFIINGSVFGHAPPPLHHFGEPENRGDEYEALWNLSERIGQAKARGLSKFDIEKIPSFRYGAASKSQSNGSCVVCMMDYSNREKLRKLPCSHDFHSKCIDRWLKSNRTCPICRDEVKV